MPARPWISRRFGGRRPTWGLPSANWPLDSLNWYTVIAGFFPGGPLLLPQEVGMDSRKALLRGVRLLLFAALALLLWSHEALAAGGPKKKGMDAGRPPFTVAGKPQERQSPFEAWRKQ